MPRIEQVFTQTGTTGQVAVVQTDGSFAAGTVSALSSGTVSKQIQFVQDWDDGTGGQPAAGPASGTLGNFDTLDFDPDTDQGVRFNFKVPDDYDSGDLTLNVTYAMATASTNPVILLWKADIVEEGNVDTSTYTLDTAQITPSNDTDPHRETPADGPGNAPVISEGDFVAGDTIQWFFGRDADNGSDTNLYDFKVITFDVSYTAQIAHSRSIQHIQLFKDTDETAPASGTLGNFDTLDYAHDADNEQKFEFIVPEEWDGQSDVHIRATYAMGAGTGGNVVLETEGSIADVSGSDIDTISVQKVLLAVASDTNPHKSVVIKSLRPAEIGAGDTVVLKLARRGTDADDTANSNLFKLINVFVTTGIGPSEGFNTISTWEGYLYQHSFGSVVGSPDAELVYPTIGTENETWLKVTGNNASEAVQVVFQGRLGLSQTKISQIKIPVKGTATATYRIRVYVDSSGATPVYDSTATAFPTSRNLLTILDTDVLWTGGQPTGESRYFVAVNIAVDAAEIGNVGYPFVKQE